MNVESSLCEDTLESFQRLSFLKASQTPVKEVLLVWPFYTWKYQGNFPRVTQLTSMRVRPESRLLGYTQLQTLLMYNFGSGKWKQNTEIHDMKSNLQVLPSAVPE